MKPNRGLTWVQRFAGVIDKSEIRNDAERIGHRDNAVANLDPVPCHAGGALFVRFPPQRLSAGRPFRIAKRHNARTKVGEAKRVNAPSLTQ